MKELIQNQKIDKIIKTYFFLSSFMFAYATLVSVLFLKWVVPVYGYTGFSINIDYLNLLLSVLYLLIITMLINLNKDKIKVLIQNLLIMQSIIPMLCLYSFTSEFSKLDHFVLMFICSTVIISIVLLVKIKSKNVHIKSKTKTKLNAILLFIILITLARYIINNGFKIFNLSFARVYDYRLTLRETMSGYMSYVDGWVFKIFNPTCIALALHYKQKILFVFFIVMQIFLYGFSSHKSVLFVGFIVVSVYYLTPYILKNKYNLLKMAIFANLIATVLWKINVTGYFCAIYNRLLFTPARINYYYYEYFSKNGFDWFRHSFLRKFAQSKYELLLPRLIGLEYYGNAQTNANTGFLGFGYAQGGFFVVIIYSLLVAILITLISSVAKKIPPRLVLSISIFPILSLFISGDLPTSLLTGGIIIMIIILYLLSFERAINLIKIKTKSNSYYIKSKKPQIKNNILNE